MKKRLEIKLHSLNLDNSFPPCKNAVTSSPVRIYEPVQHGIHYFTCFNQNFLILNQYLQTTITRPLRDSHVTSSETFTYVVLSV